MKGHDFGMGLRGHGGIIRDEIQVRFRLALSWRGVFHNSEFIHRVIFLTIGEDNTKLD
jgi:hypothetical protein